MFKINDQVIYHGALADYQGKIYAIAINYYGEYVYYFVGCGMRFWVSGEHLSILE